MKEPAVSVIVPVYNAQKYLSATLDSVLAQTFSDFECILIDDGSTDASVEIVQSYEDDRIVLMRNPTNLGQTPSMNRAIRIARGEFIARLDSDDICMPERFARQVDFLAHHPEIAGVGGQLLVIDENGDLLADTSPAYESEPALLYFDMFYFCSVAHPAMMLRRQVFGDFGLYSEEQRYAQDYELWHRVLPSRKFSNLSAVILHYRMNQNGITRSNLSTMTEDSIGIVANAFSSLTGTSMSREACHHFRGTRPLRRYRDFRTFLKRSQQLVDRIVELYRPSSAVCSRLHRRVVTRFLERVRQVPDAHLAQKALALLSIGASVPWSSAAHWLERLGKRELPLRF